MSTSDPPLVDVVAAAIVRDGRTLVAHRARPPGGWEFPGGKVEPGESPADALRRECREELGVDVTPGAVLAVATDHRIRLTLVRAELSDGGGEPRAGVDHDALRWLTPTDLDNADNADDADLGGLDWLPLDRDLLAILRTSNRPGRL